MQPTVYVVNRNRVTALRRLVNWLLEANASRVVILDNASDYPPLVDYYEHEMPGEVDLIYVNQNLGPHSLYHLGLVEETKEDYILTDSDVVPSDCCPKDLIAKMQEVLARYPQRCKCGPSLRTDNIPDSVPWKQRIIDENKDFWTTRLDHECFSAAIDTTFALYRYGTWSGPDPSACIRLDFPYVAEHTPWYVWPLTEEEIYYAKSSLGPPISHIRKFWQLEGVQEVM